MQTFCISKELVFLLFIIGIIYYLNEKIEKRTKRKTRKRRNIKRQRTSSCNITRRTVSNYLLHRDYSVLHDPLKAPTRRVARHNYTGRMVLNVATRGCADNYQYLGNLVRRNDNKLVKLFGRQTYPRSREYEYYGVVSDQGGNQIKVQITNTREIYNGDIVKIPILNNNSGNFVAHIHKLDQPRYYPCIN
jgi:hypothetical protein